jgi:hypothetical protein
MVLLPMCSSLLRQVWIDVLLGAGVDVEVCRVYEVGKIPPLRIKKEKDKLRGRAAGKGRASKVKVKASDSDDEQEPNLQQGDEEDEPWSSSEDGRDVAESERHDTRADRTSQLQDVQPPSQPAREVEDLDTIMADPEDDNPPHASSPAPTDVGAPGKRCTRELEPDAQQEVNQAAERGRASTLTSSERPAHPSLGSAVLMTPVRAAREHPPTPRSGAFMPAPALPPAHGKVKAEPLSPTISMTGSQASTIGKERTNPDGLTQETTIPETPPSPSQHESQVGSPNPSSIRTCKQWRDEPRVTPIKNKQKENDLITEPPNATTFEVTRKRKRKDSSAHTSAPGSTVPVSPTAFADFNHHEPVSKEDSIAASRTPRKRTSASSGRGGLALSPLDWEKKWPEVFPKWVGDMAGGDSDADYEPSQSQSQSQ